MTDVFAVSCQIFFSDPEQAARRDRPDARLVGERRPARAPSRSIRRSQRSLPLLLRRRRILRLRPPKVSGTGRLRRAARALSTWKTPTSAIWPGSAAGRCSTSRAAWCITSIAAPSARSFREDQIEAVLKKNFLLFCWKNIHEWPRLVSHFFFAWAGAVVSVLFGDVAGARQISRDCGARSGNCPQRLRSRARAREPAR